ncbi:MAG: DUF5522 domain-containing protein [Pyrinomonadaceae bacterium]
MISAERKICAGCQSSFSCGAAGGEAGACWCESVSGILESPGGALDCFCPKCLESMISNQSSVGHLPQPNGQSGFEAEKPLVEGEDYYLEGNNCVFTSQYLRRRGFCCNSGCRHCPYGETAALIEIT